MNTCDEGGSFSSSERAVGVPPTAHTHTHNTQYFVVNTVCY